MKNFEKVDMGRIKMGAKVYKFTKNDADAAVKFFADHGIETEVKTVKDDDEGSTPYYEITKVEKVETTEEQIERIFNQHFTEDYDQTDESAIMVDQYIEETGHDLTDLNYEKLSREDKMAITGLEYTNITLDYIELHHSNDAMVYILEKIFDRMADGKSAKRQIKKWLR